MAAPPTTSSSGAKDRDGKEKDREREVKEGEGVASILPAALAALLPGRSPGNTRDSSSKEGVERDGAAPPRSSSPARSPSPSPTGASGPLLLPASPPTSQGPGHTSAAGQPPLSSSLLLARSSQLQVLPRTGSRLRQSSSAPLSPEAAAAAVEDVSTSQGQGQGHSPGSGGGSSDSDGATAAQRGPSEAGHAAGRGGLSGASSSEVLLGLMPPAQGLGPHSRGGSAPGQGLEAGMEEPATAQAPAPEPAGYEGHVTVGMAPVVAGAGTGCSTAGPASGQGHEHAGPASLGPSTSPGAGLDTLQPLSFGGDSEAAGQFSSHSLGPMTATGLSTAASHGGVLVLGPAGVTPLLPGQQHHHGHPDDTAPPSPATCGPEDAVPPGRGGAQREGGMRKFSVWLTGLLAAGVRRSSGSNMLVRHASLARSQVQCLLLGA